MKDLVLRDGGSMHIGNLRYAEIFTDATPPLTKAQALIEAERCYDCYDAPCQHACPTNIDMPSFIQRIAQHNNRGAAEVILQANPLGGMCARVCPTEVLCEQACVRNSNEKKAVEIGLLQRYATDAFFANPNPPLFLRESNTGKRVAIVGAGPAGLACAHGLARKGHNVTIYEARPKLGGLNEYGLAAYKTVGNFAQKEIQWLLSIGGIDVYHDKKLGRDMTLDELMANYDAVFLGMGLTGMNTLGITAPAIQGVRNAVEFIADLRQAKDVSIMSVGRRVVVIGGGMTAIDAAVQSKMLGAEEVTIAYRRSAADMPASPKEQKWAQTNGVSIRHWIAPQELLSQEGRVTGVRFQRTALQKGKLVAVDESFVIAADMVLKAIGQTFEPEPMEGKITTKNGRIATDIEGRTNLPRVWAGGDCRAGGLNLTVEAVEHGKRAAESIHQSLTARGML